MTVAMENVKEWSGRTKNVEDDYRSLILGADYSNFFQLISTLYDSTITMLSVSAVKWSFPMNVTLSSLKNLYQSKS